LEAIAMNISKFLRLSLGQWRSQRTGHTWDTCEIDDLNMTLDIVALTIDDESVVRVCRQCDLDPDRATFPFQMTWLHAGQTEVAPDDRGIFVPIPQPDNANFGRMLQSHRNSSSPVTIGKYHFNPDGTFVLTTEHPATIIEEKIWFATPNLRLQVFVSKPKVAGDRATTTFISENRLVGNSIPTMTAATV
jgi:phycoerythrin-associated linker protein